MIAVTALDMQQIDLEVLYNGNSDSPGEAVSLLLVVGLLIACVAAILLLVGVAYPDVADTIVGLPSNRAVGAILAVFVLALIVLLWHLNVERYQDYMARADRYTQQQIDARALIETSLTERYEIVAIRPSLTTKNPDGSGLLWHGRWIVDAFERSPFTAPHADVELADGTIVTWGVLVDAETSEARFIARADAPTPGPLPDDVAKN